MLPASGYPRLRASALYLLLTVVVAGFGLRALVIAAPLGFRAEAQQQRLVPQPGQDTLAAAGPAASAQLAELLREVELTQQSQRAFQRAILRVMVWVGGLALLLRVYDTTQDRMASTIVAVSAGGTFGVLSVQLHAVVIEQALVALLHVVQAWLTGPEHGPTWLLLGGILAMLAGWYDLRRRRPAS